MQLSDFSYHLPTELIAQEPSRPRDHARLMVVNRATEEITHHHIYDLPKLLGKEWALVANNTKVFPARLRGKKPTGGQVEVLLLHPQGSSRYSCIVRGSATHILFDEVFSGDIVDRAGEYEKIIEFNLDEEKLRAKLSEIGEMPTPPYIKKLLANKSDYQTIYAKCGFSAAAPTAGLHFTKELLSLIKAKHPWEEITLDVGLGTFLPVKVEDITKHQMHSEQYTITKKVADRLNQLKRSHKLLAVGTTTTRALESSYQGGEITAQSVSTNIFLYPPRRFNVVNGLLTNFHLPESTLLMLVSAFVSHPNTNRPFTTFQESLIGRAYQLAVEEKYHFFSFGDAMLII